MILNILLKIFKKKTKNNKNLFKKLNFKFLPQISSTFTLEKPNKSECKQKTQQSTLDRRSQSSPIAPDHASRVDQFLSLFFLTHRASTRRKFMEI
jgi:hypothetical protein